MLQMVGDMRCESYESKTSGSAAPIRAHGNGSAKTQSTFTLIASSTSRNEGALSASIAILLFHGWRYPGAGLYSFSACSLRVGHKKQKHD